jgi:hypothetical protein
MKTLCNIVLLVVAAAGTAARAQPYTTPVTVTNLSCTDSEGTPCPGGLWNDDFYDFYAQSDGTCKDSSTPANYTYPSAVAYVYNDDGYDADVQTSMTSVSNGGGGNIDAVDSKHRERGGPVLGVRGERSGLRRQCPCRSNR